MLEIKVIDNGNVRIDKYLKENTEYSRSKIQKFIDNGNVLVNEVVVKASYIVRNGDVISINQEMDNEMEILPEDIKLDILYEDDYLLVVNKPSGMVVHPGCGNYSHTLVNALMYRVNKLSSVNGSVRPGIVHRIDADTSGLLLVAKNDMVHNDLANQIAKKSVIRKYIALVVGVINEDTATIDAPIGRDKIDRKKMCVTATGKDAVTHYKVLERFGQATYVECRLETGRTHQIRVHMASIGHPLLGDTVYGSSRNPYHLEGQALHAMILGFVHPRTGEYMEFTAPLPEYFVKLLSKLRK